MPNATLELTPEQSALIQAIAAAEVSILGEAVAGSGKTTTLVSAANQIPEDRSVLALAFNRSIADELASRMPEHVTVKSFHALGFQICRQIYSNKLGRVNSHKLGDIITAVLTKYELTQTDPENPDSTVSDSLWSDIKAAINYARASGAAPPKLGAINLNPILPLNCPENEHAVWSAITETYYLDIPPDLFHVCTEILTQTITQFFKGNFDFDDMIHIPNVVTHNKWPKFSQVLVDEAQDLSPLQQTMVKNVLAPDGKVVAIGDRHQAIYAFRGADSSSILNLINKFNLQSYPLTVSFRCPQAVVREAQPLVPHIKPSSFAPEGLVETLDSWTLDSIENYSAILCRNNAPLIRLAIKLLISGRRPKIQGIDLNKSLIKIIKTIKTSTRPELIHGIKSWAATERDKAAGKIGRISYITDQEDCLLAAVEADPSIHTPKHLTDKLLELFSSGSSQITLSSIHRSKGQEWDHVYFLNPELIPSKFAKTIEELAQEQNLKYIAVTRAKQILTYISFSDFQGA